MSQDFSSSENIAGPASRPTASDRVPAATKPRSCITCRTRRVRCDKRSPCSNCRRANIACVIPSTEGPPRWARNLEKRPGAATANPQPVTPNIAKVKERLRNLEGLVEQFSREIDEANAAANAAASGPSVGAGVGEQSALGSRSQASGNTDLVPREDGRFCGLNAHYVTSRFWTKIDQELAGLRADTRDFAGLESDSSEDEAPTQETAVLLPTTTPPPQLPSEHASFLFATNLNASLNEYRPLASQIPYLLEVYERNVNFFVRVIHMPTLLKTTRSEETMATLAPADEALLFAVYYAAIASMEDSDVQSGFGFSKTELTARYRIGLETCLARADFLNNPTVTIVKALTLFLGLHRRSGSPRFVWMMFGLLTRMAQYLGLHRDGECSPHLTVYEVEMRRRVWWTMCLIDQETAEDQGTHITYASLDFDTKPPLNINDSDLDPQTAVAPPERYGVTDMSFARICAALTEVHRHLLSSSPNLSLDEKGRLITQIYQNFQSQFLQYTTDTDGGIGYWVSVCMARLVMAKLTLLSFGPMVYSPAPNPLTASKTDTAIGTKLFHAAIHVAEYNHAMNAEESCKHWRWVYQTCTHWHSSVYLALEIPRREWGPIVERAWVGLNSPWLIPSKALNDQDTQIWFPIRKLIRNVQEHREAELHRLRADPQAARELERKARETPFASHPAPFPTAGLSDVFFQRWRCVVGLDDGSPSTMSSAALDDPLVFLTYSAQLDEGGLAAHTQRPELDREGRETSVVGTESLFAELGPLPGDPGMELDTGEDWQVWIDSALNAEHVDLQEEY